MFAELWSTNHTMATKQEKAELDWLEVDPDTLHADVAEAFAVYKEAYKTAKGFRDIFEALATEKAELPATHRMVFGYGFGKLSIAIDLAKVKGKSKKAVAFSTLKVPKAA